MSMEHWSVTGFGVREDVLELIPRDICKAHICGRDWRVKAECEKLLDEGLDPQDIASEEDMLLNDWAGDNYVANDYRAAVLVETIHDLNNDVVLQAEHNEDDESIVVIPPLLAWEMNPTMKEMTWEKAYHLFVDALIKLGVSNTDKLDIGNQYMENWG